MRSVFTFWQMPSDEMAFFEYLSRKNIIAYPVGGFATTAELDPIPLSRYVQERRGSRCFLTLAALKNEIAIDTSDEDGHRVFFIDPIQSSVLGYSPGSLGNGALSNSNAYAYWNTLRSKALVRKGDEFTKWAKAVLNWLRHSMVPAPDSSPSITAAVKEAMQAGMSIIDH